MDKEDASVLGGVQGRLVALEVESYSSRVVVRVGNGLDPDVLKDGVVIHCEREGEERTTRSVFNALKDKERVRNKK